MKHKLLLSSVALLSSASFSSAATGFYDGLYFITSLNSGSNIYNQVTTGTTPGSGAAQGHNIGPDGSNPQFSNFGTLDITDVLSLKGFEYKTFQNNSSSVTHANLFYRIFPTSGTPGPYTQLQAATNFSTGNINKTWAVTNGSTNLLSGLSNGTYTIELMTESYTNGNNTAGNIFGFSSNPTATFSVVPETTTSLLGGIGLLLLLRRRR